MMEKDKEKDLESLKPLAHSPAHRQGSLVFWILVNVCSTIAIVFINKAIFLRPAFHNAQLIFASYHFFLTFLLLSLLSSPSPWLSAIKHFERKAASPLKVFPLAASMCASVVFLNTSLAYCTVPFYQTVRVLLTPVVALINYFFFSKSIPHQAVWFLLPTCVGVAYMAYSDTMAASQGKPAKAKPGAASSTSAFGATFALTGVVVSSVYTVWIAVYHTKLEMNSTQLLHAQSMVAAVLLLVLGLASGAVPDFAAFDRRMWEMNLLSGMCATLLNLSQFKVVAMAGPVAGTVVGHVKTICVVLIGWSVSTNAVSNGSIVGILVAIGGIVGYSVAERRYGGR